MKIAGMWTGIGLIVQRAVAMVGTRIGTAHITLRAVTMDGTHMVIAAIWKPIRVGHVIPSGCMFSRVTTRPVLIIIRLIRPTMVPRICLCWVSRLDTRMGSVATVGIMDTATIIGIMKITDIAATTVTVGVSQLFFNGFMKVGH